MSLRFQIRYIQSVKSIYQVKVLKYKLTLLKKLDRLFLFPSPHSHVSNTIFNARFALCSGQTYFFLANHGCRALELWREGNFRKHLIFTTTNRGLENLSVFLRSVWFYWTNWNIIAVPMILVLSSRYMYP